MKKKEINEIMAHVAALSDEKLEEEYYTAVDNCLGSQVDTMIERGYDSVDIIEREKHEKYLSEYADMLGYLCDKRNIKFINKCYFFEDASSELDGESCFLWPKILYTKT